MQQDVCNKNRIQIAGLELVAVSFGKKVDPENTHLSGKYYCTVGFHLNWFRFYQKRKCVVML